MARSVPWWQLTRTPGLGLVLGALSTALAAGGLPFLVLDEDRSPLLLAGYVLFGLLGRAHLASAAALRRRLRTPTPPLGPAARAAEDTRTGGGPGDGSPGASAELIRQLQPLVEPQLSQT